MNRISILLLLFSGLAAMGQDSLTFEQALVKTLESNHFLKVSQNNVEQSQTQVNPGMAGLLPTISAQGSANYAINNTRIQVQNSTDVFETRGAEQQNLRASVNMDYTIFSGFRNKYQYEFLKNSADISEVQHRINIENTVLQLATAYMDALRAQSNITAIQASVEASLKRLELARSRYELAGGSSLNVLTAQVDLNQDSSLLLNAEASYQTSIYTLNQIMGSEIDSDVRLAQMDDPLADLSLQILLDESMEYNTELLRLRLLEDQSLTNLSISKSAYLPQLNLSSSYSYSNVNAEGSFLRLNQSDGFGSTLTLSVPIFNGNANRINKEISEMQLVQNTEQQIQTELETESAIRSAFIRYNNALKIMNLERKSIELAEKNFEYNKTLYENGNVNSIQFREAQTNLLLAKNSYINAVFNAKLAELELLRLSGKLLPKDI